MKPSIKDLKNSSGTLKFEISESKENFVNEILATIRKSSLMYRFGIVQDMETLIHCLFSANMNPPALTFRYIIITHLYTARVLIENATENLVNDCIVINLSNLISPPQYSAEYEKLKLESFESKIAKYHHQQHMSEFKSILLGSALAVTTGGAIYLGQKYISKL